MNCIVCNQPIPKNRISIVHRKVRYCSKECIKRNYYIKDNRNKSSYFNSQTRNNWFSTTTGKGYIWEQFTTTLLGGEWQSFGAPFDILWKGKKVDVKTCNVYSANRENQRGWFAFHKNSPEKRLDYLFCIGMVQNIPYKMWLIPYDVVGNHFCIGFYKSKLDKYLFKA
jgi:hypothetical protein